MEGSDRAIVPRIYWLAHWTTRTSGSYFSAGTCTIWRRTNCALRCNDCKTRKRAGNCVRDWTGAFTEGIATPNAHYPPPHPQSRGSTRRCKRPKLYQLNLWNLWEKHCWILVISMILKYGLQMRNRREKSGKYFGIAEPVKEKNRERSQLMQPFI